MAHADHYDHLPEPVKHRIAQQTGRHQPLPDALRHGLEGLTGCDLSHVRVHYNSHKPTQLGAPSFSSGHDIYLAPGQERHLAHEAWHVVQQGHHGPLHAHKPRISGHRRPHGHGHGHGHGHPDGHKHPGSHGHGKPGGHGGPHDHLHKHPTHGQGHGQSGHKAGSAAHEAHVMGHRALVHGHHHKG